jgi:hypothetical protein
LAPICVTGTLEAGKPARWRFNRADRRSLPISLGRLPRRVTGEPEPWLTFGYGFDDIGNRQYATAHGE